MSTTTIQQSVMLSSMLVRDLEQAKKLIDKSECDDALCFWPPNHIKTECESMQHALSLFSIYLEEDNSAYRNIDLFRTVFQPHECDLERRSYFREKTVLLNEAFEKFVVDEKSNESRSFFLKEQFLNVFFDGERENVSATNENVFDEVWGCLSHEQKLFFREKSISLSDEIEEINSEDNVAGSEVNIAKKYSSELFYSEEVGSLGDSISGNSLGDIWKQLAEIIGGVAKKNLDDYASALDKYTSLYQGVTDILGKFGQWVSADGDSKMKVQVAEIKKALDDLCKKYEPPSEDGIIAGKTAAGLSKSEAEAICEKLGLEEGAIHQNADGTYCVVVNLEQIKSMLSQLPESESMSIASYNAWKAGFDAQTNRIEDILQARGQKYSNSFSRFENFHKTISSIVEAMKNMLEKFLQF